MARWVAGEEKNSICNRKHHYLMLLAYVTIKPQDACQAQQWFNG